jgi:adenylate kinase family enzyme
MSGVLFLIRGLPGSGKTSFASAIWNDYAVCEADKFFYDKDGNYNFDV